MTAGLLCSSSAWGGLEINIFNLAFWLTQRGNHILLICKPDTHLSREALKKNIPIVYFDQGKRKHLNFKAALRLKKILEAHQLQTLIIGHYEQHYTAVLAKIFSFDNPIYLIYLQQMQAKFKKNDPYHAFFFQRTDLWLTPLHSLKTQLFKNTTLSEKQIRVVPLCTDVKNFTNPTISKKEARDLFNLPQSKFVVGIMGRLDREKGQEYLIKALKIIRAKDIDMHVVITGSETEGGTGYTLYLKNLVRELHLVDFVHFLPFTKNATDFFTAIDVFAMCSISEPYGMVTLEAMLSGVPVVGTNSGGTPELMEYGNLGYIVPPADINALAEAITNYYLHPLDYEAIRIKAKQTVSEKYSHALWCEMIENLIPKALNN